VNVAIDGFNFSLNFYFHIVKNEEYLGLNHLADVLFLFEIGEGGGSAGIFAGHRNNYTFKLYYRNR
jgi:hypothetical protein